jgi:predicted NBD/HSP70 family sugar kinase
MASPSPLPECRTARSDGPARSGLPGQQVAITPETVRVLNDRATLQGLLRQGPLTAAGIRSLTNASKPTVYGSLTRLESMGIVGRSQMDIGGHPRLGRRGEVFRVLPGIAHAAGVHLSRRQATVLVADVTGRVIAKRTVPSADRSAPSAVAAARLALVESTADVGLHPADLGQVVFGVPGVVQPGADVLERAPGLPGWEGAAFAEALARELRAPVGLENEVNLAAVAEQHRSVAAERNSCLTLWVDEAVGMAVITHGRLLRGASGRAGGIDRLPVAPPSAHGGPVRFADTVDGPALVDMAREYGLGDVGADGRSVLRLALSPESGSAGELLLREYARRLVAGLAAAVYVVDPELVVLSGTFMVAGGERLRSLVSRELGLLAPDAPEIAVSGLDGDAVVVGALRTAVERAQQSVLLSVHM